MIDTATLRGSEGMASNRYFSVFSLMLKQQRSSFHFVNRSRRPPRDAINCLLSFLYALVRHDCIAGLTAAGLDPFVGFLHVDRPQVGQKDWVLLRDRLVKEIDAGQDSLRFYFLDDKAAQRIEHFGVEKPINLSDPLIL